MFIWTKHKWQMLLYQWKVYKFSSHFHCFILQYRLMGCDKLILFYCVYIWFRFTLVLAGINSKLLNHRGYLLQPQISFLNILFPVTTQCNYITLARVSSVREGGILFVFLWKSDPSAEVLKTHSTATPTVKQSTLVPSLALIQKQIIFGE